MCESWGYKGLAGATTKRAIEEMKHAEKLISRMLFLEGEPDVQTLHKIQIGKDVEEQLTIGLKDETGAISSYNAGVAICTKAGDNASAELLKGNLGDEERHADYLDTQLNLIKQLGLPNYLARAWRRRRAALHLILAAKPPRPARHPPGRIHPCRSPFRRGSDRCRSG